jgi:transcriptional regulator with XRE-family HTH domain
MQNNFNCIYCGSAGNLFFKKKTKKLRNDSFELFEASYKCKQCKKEFTTEETEKYNLNQLYNQYRELYNIPFPEQLKYTREKFDLTYLQISDVLGIGINQYRLYEKGELPTTSNATLLSLFINPEGLKEIITHKKNYQNKKYFDKLLTQIEDYISNIKHFDLKTELFDASVIPNKYTGYRVPNFEKFANMVLFFVKDASFKVRLNKYLFYADFIYYKYFGSSISGCTYVALPLGPIPDNYSLIYGLLERENYLTTELVPIKNTEHEMFIPLNDFEGSIFTKDELLVLQSVADNFKPKSTDELWQLSHEELAWKDNKDITGRIDYLNYAPQLIAV